MPNNNGLNVQFGSSKGSAKRVFQNRVLDNRTVEDEILQDIIQYFMNLSRQVYSAWVCGNIQTFNGIQLNENVSLSDSVSPYIGDGCGTINYNYDIQTELLYIFGLNPTIEGNINRNYTSQSDGNILAEYSFYLKFDNIVIPSYTSYCDINVNGACAYIPFNETFNQKNFSSSITLSGLRLPVNISCIILQGDNVNSTLQIYKNNPSEYNIVPFNLVGSVKVINTPVFGREVFGPRDGLIYGGTITQVVHDIYWWNVANNSVSVESPVTQSTLSSPNKYTINQLFVKKGKNKFGLFITNLNINVNTSNSTNFSNLTLCGQGPSDILLQLGVKSNYLPQLPNIINNVFTTIFNTINSNVNNTMLIFSEICIVETFSCLASSSAGCYNCTLMNDITNQTRYFNNVGQYGLIYSTSVSQINDVVNTW